MMARFLTAAAAFSILAASAQAQPMLQRGAQELSVHISPDFEGAIGDTIFADAGYGRLLRDGFAVRAVVSYTILEDVAGEDSDYRTSEVGVAGELHLHRRSQFVPYLGLGLGWRSSHFADFEEAALVYGPRAGIKLFVADNVAVDLEVTYKLGAADVFINDFVAEDTDLSSAIGLRVFF